MSLILDLDLFKVTDWYVKAYRMPISSFSRINKFLKALSSENGSKILIDIYDYPITSYFERKTSDKKLMISNGRNVSKYFQTSEKDRKRVAKVASYLYLIEGKNRIKLTRPGKRYTEAIDGIKSLNQKQKEILLKNIKGEIFDYTLGRFVSLFFQQMSNKISIPDEEITNSKEIKNDVNPVRTKYFFGKKFQSQNFIRIARQLELIEKENESEDVYHLTKKGNEYFLEFYETLRSYQPFTRRQQSLFNYFYPYAQTKGMAAEYMLVDVADVSLYSREEAIRVKDLLRLIDALGIQKLLEITPLIKKSQIKSLSTSGIRKILQKTVIERKSALPVNRIRERIILPEMEKNIVPWGKRNYDSLLGVVMENQQFETAFEHIMKEYTKPVEKKIAVFTTCAKEKPYPTGVGFKQLWNKVKIEISPLDSHIHWLVLSNATAPIPEEYHYSFPFYAYESNLSDFDDLENEQYKRIAVRRLKKYLKKYKYDHLIGYIKPGSIQRDIINEVTSDLNLENKVIICPSEKVVEIAKEKTRGLYSLVLMKQNVVVYELIERILSRFSRNEKDQIKKRKKRNLTAFF
ncbi:MAG: DUF5591 domain-containing protein [Promethearchaeota archaeon]